MSRTSALRAVAIAIGISALSLCVANIRVQAAYEAYLKIEGLDGGSKDPAHMGWIAITQIASGNLSGESARMPGRNMSSGMASNKRTHNSLEIVKEIDQASPKLFQACTSGKRFATALVDTGSTRYKLYNVVIASVQKSGVGDRPTETITLNYEKIEISVQPGGINTTHVVRGTLN